MNEVNKILSQRLKETRLRLGFTQKQICEKLNIEIGTLSGYELGRRSPNPERLSELSRIYNVSIDYLLGKDKEDPIQKVIDHAETMNLTPEEREAIEEYKKMPPSEQQKELLDAIETIKNLPEANREVLLKFIKVFSSSCQ